MNNVLESIKSLIGKELKQVDEVILSEITSPTVLIPKIASHMILSGGKRLRPILTLLSARLCGYNNGDRHINLAACIEFIHTATLLHDDVVDESDLRRGNKTANNIWGNQASVLVGDFLLSRAFQLMVKDGSLKALEILSNTSAIISEGEVMQLSASRNLKTTEEEYLKIISAKTAKLFATACEIGAVITGENDKYQNALEQYGHNLGIAFQIVDDALDYSAKQEALGKTIGDDLREGKITLPVIHAYRNGNNEDKEFWKRTLEQEDIKDGDLDHAILLINNTNSLGYSISIAKNYVQNAKNLIKLLPNLTERDLLINLADFAVDREY